MFSRFLSLLIFFAAALIAFSASAARAYTLPDEREELFIIYKGANPVGFSYTTLTKKHIEGKGGPLWEIESEIFIQFSVDGKAMETQQKSVELINGGLEVVKLFKESNIGNTKYRMWAEKRGQILVQTTRFSNKEYKKEIPYPHGAVPLSALPIYLAQTGLDSIGNTTIRALSFSHTAAYETEISLSASDKWEDFAYGGRTVRVKRIDTKIDDVATTYKMDTEGNIYEAVQPILSLVQKKLELADYYTIEGWLPWDISRSPMSDAGTKKVKNPDKVTRLDVELEWSDSKPPAGAALELAAAQQKLVKQTNTRNEGPKYLLQVVRAPAKFAFKPLKKMPSEKDLAKYLAADPMIQADDPGVIAAAARAEGDATGTLAASYAIAAWIYENITPDPTSWLRSPAAARTLEDGTGMDKHAAILFAAMARARGFHTRICAGRLYSMGLFVPHFWNEVFIDGKWWPLDATSADSAAYSVPLLIKYAHGATVEQTATALEKIDAKLIIKIIDYGYK